jgi:Tol biopolymer transport system component
LPVEPDLYQDTAFSPDGSRLAVTVLGGNDVIAIHDMRRGTTSRLTRTGWDNHDPLWTPDGKHLLFQSNMSGTDLMYWQPTDGSGAAEQLVGGDEELVPGSFSPDGTLLAYMTIDQAERADILVVPFGADGPAGEPVRFTETPYSEVAPSISPNGKWIAYASDETDSWQVYVQPFPDGGAKWQISTNGGGAPLWSPDGSTIYYVSVDDAMAVDVTTTSGFVADAPRVLHAAGEPRILFWALPPAGGRFLCTVPLHESGVDRLRVVLNLFGELRGGRSGG